MNESLGYLLSLNDNDHGGSSGRESPCEKGAQEGLGDRRVVLKHPDQFTVASC